MKMFIAAVLLVFGVALINHDEDEAPAPQPTVEQRDPNLGPPGSVG